MNKNIFIQVLLCIIKKAIQCNPKYNQKVLLYDEDDVMTSTIDSKEKKKIIEKRVI